MNHAPVKYLIFIRYSLNYVAIGLLFSSKIKRANVFKTFFQWEHIGRILTFPLTSIDHFKSLPFFSFITALHHGFSILCFWWLSWSLEPCSREDGSKPWRQPFLLTASTHKKNGDSIRHSYIFSSILISVNSHLLFYNIYGLRETILIFISDFVSIYFNKKMTTKWK